MKKYIKAKKFVWVDLEMTGLDPKNSRIIEVAAIITDVELNEIETYEAVIHQPRRVLARADKWVRDNMQEVLQQSSESSTKISQVDSDLSKLMKKHFKDHAILAGNSIHQDRRFIRNELPRFEAKLHYRMLDVSAWKVYMVAKYNTEATKPTEHRALSDIRGSISELKHYLEFFETNV